MVGWSPHDVVMAYLNVSLVFERRYCELPHFVDFSML